MNIIRLGTRFINLDRVIDAEICIDEDGRRAILLRYVIAESGSRGNALMSLQISHPDAEALEAYLNECGVVLTSSDPTPVEPCDTSSSEGPMPTILEV